MINLKFGIVLNQEFGIWNLESGIVLNQESGIMLIIKSGYGHTLTILALYYKPITNHYIL